MKRGDAKRAALLQAAATTMLEKGIAGATTREIAERAGSTERTLFKQFGSKDGLVTAVLDRVALGELDRSHFAELRSDPPRTLDAFEAWDRALIRERVGSQGAGSEVGRLFLLEILQNPAFKARYTEPWLEKLWRPLVACLDELKGAGEIDRQVDTAFLARSFIGLHLSYLVARLNVAPSLNWDTDRDAVQLAGLFRRAVQRT